MLPSSGQTVSWLWFYITSPTWVNVGGGEHFFTPGFRLRQRRKTPAHIYKPQCYTSSVVLIWVSLQLKTSTLDFKVKTHLVMNRLCCSSWIKYQEAVCHVGPSLQHNAYNYKFTWSSKNCSSTAFMFRVMKKCWTAAGFILCLDICHTSLFQMFRQNQIKKRQPELTDNTDFKSLQY